MHLFWLKRAVLRERAVMTHVIKLSDGVFGHASIHAIAVDDKDWTDVFAMGLRCLNEVLDGVDADVTG